jgi:hypothetical protein
MSNKVRNFADQMMTPAGWNKIIDSRSEFGNYGGYALPEGDLAVRYVSPDRVRIIEFRLSEAGKFSPKGSTVAWSGTTSFLKAGIRMSFDQIGIGDSFYGCDKDTGKYGRGGETPAETIEKQNARITKALELSAISKPVPGLPYSLTPDQIASYSKTIQAGKSITLHPCGMGTAHRISKTRSSKYDAAGSPELAVFFGVSKVFVSRVDWD